jgi:alkylation response protein AidB-like acyl-CoA dehydrogenase
VKHPAYLHASDFDRRMGDPGDSGRVFCYARCGALDDREEFPLEICRELDFLGLPAHYVPSGFGGELADYEHSLQLMRAIARRDLTVAVAHGKTFLGAVSVWVGGEPEQARALGADISAGAVVSWGLTEREHGSDLLAGEVVATPTEDGFLVSGEKWLINNANRGQLVCLLARTGTDNGPRDFSLLLVDKRKLDQSRFRPLPGVRLHGIRGADISGITFTDAPVPRSAVVGAEGGGIEIVLKGLQLTRTLCASLSLGAADNALRLATGYALRRNAYGRRLIDLPQTRRILAQSYADLLLAEAVTLVASRSIHALTGELAIVSAVTKYLVPTLVDGIIRQLATVLGARSLLVGDTYEHGRFQKLQRDHRIVGIFDGNTLVNLHALINQFTILAKQFRRGTINTAGLRTATTLAEPLPSFDRDLLTLLPRKGSSVAQALPNAVAELCELAERGEVPASLGRRAAQIGAVTDELVTMMAENRPTPVNVPASAFTLAERFARCFAASAAIHLWLRNHKSGTELWNSGLWLEACLARLLDQLSPARPDGTDDVFERLVPTMAAQHESGELLSLLHYSLAQESA